MRQSSLRGWLRDDDSAGQIALPLDVRKPSRSIASRMWRFAPIYLGVMTIAIVGRMASLLANEFSDVLAGTAALVALLSFVMVGVQSRKLREQKKLLDKVQRDLDARERRADQDRRIAHRHRKSLRKNS